MPDGLSCTCLIPLAWHAVQLDQNALNGRIREAALLLTALNQMETTHELETGSPENRRLDRIEAKLDLTLRLLARTLEPPTLSENRVVQLTPEGAQWPDSAPPTEGTTLLLELQLSEALPLSLKLPATARPPIDGNAYVRFQGLSEVLDEALYQFVFRRHRQAIRARTA